ncbi:MAG: ParA family protein [Phycisphaerales bacterium]|jgi:chromosome partitioning protein|nr:ParA family protein [Phycisphaerales bacterium]MDP7190011.1 ParA family protein [Phycisphaerales bacterium]MDP7519999.1 ParA family protein [Phycisphaerales bacterium]MDP7574196.1 ParA family protein [Phycisphaerales bacterium]HJN79571.1 ParA family protein [Phycisphaerales bacterium]|tara:strand:- start:498 stop:1367 length:870 start_codon:yes stop_codon:yes gene_type:complete
MSIRRVVAIINQKGGVGKTTTTANLGAALARSGLRVCLVDLDPQAHLSLHFGIRPAEDDATIYDLLLDEHTVVDDIAIKVDEGLDLIPAETDLAAAETDLGNLPDKQNRLRRALAASGNRWDVVLIDCPPSLGILTINALSAATEVFVPMQAHFLALQGVGKLLETVGLVCGSVNPSLRVTGIVLCMHESQTTLAREVVEDLEAFLEGCREQPVPWNRCQVLRPPVRRNIKLAEAPSFGQSILTYDAGSHGAADYLALAESVTQLWRAPVSEVEVKVDASTPEGADSVG